MINLKDDFKLYYIVSVIISCLVLVLAFKGTWPVVLAVCAFFVLCAFISGKYKNFIYVFTFCVCSAFYIFLAMNIWFPQYAKWFKAGDNVAWHYTSSANYYNYLALSLLGGRVDISVKKSSQAVEDYEYVLQGATDLIWDNRNSPEFDENRVKEYERMLNYITDLSYHNGKLYMYWGIAPVLFYLPTVILFSYSVSDHIVVMILSILSMAVMSMIIRKLLHNKGLIQWQLKNLVIPLLFFGTYCIFLVRRPATYEAAIVSALFFGLSGFLILLKISEDVLSVYKKNICLFAVSSCFVLSFLSRYQTIYLSFGLCAYTFYVFVKCYIKKSQHLRCAANNFIYVLIPAAVGFLIFAAYNYLRFGSIFDVGWGYAVNQGNKHSLSLPFTRFLLNGVENIKYFLWHSFSYTDSFSFFKLKIAKNNIFTSEMFAGIINLSPVVLFAIALPVFMKAKNVAYKIKVFILMFGIAGVVNLSAVSLMSTAILRYGSDFMPYFLMVSIISFFYVYLNIQKEWLKNILIMVFIFCVVYTTTVNFFLAFHHYAFLFDVPYLYEEVTVSNSVKILERFFD